MKDYIYSNGIKACAIEEGNLGAVKSSSDFGGPNMWDLKIKNKDGWWEDVQWMNVNRIQQFFKTACVFVVFWFESGLHALLLASARLSFRIRESIKANFFLSTSIASKPRIKTAYFCQDSLPWRV
mgnify:CR=1 FL=1